VREPETNSYLVIRTAQDPSAIVKAVQSKIQSLDPQQPFSHIRSIDQLMEINIADRSRPMILLGVFAGLALVLACLGVYGVLANPRPRKLRKRPPVRSGRFVSSTAAP
jgi:hypothetical protein